MAQAPAPRPGHLRRGPPGLGLPAVGRPLDRRRQHLLPPELQAVSVWVVRRGDARQPQPVVPELRGPLLRRLPRRLVAGADEGPALRRRGRGCRRRDPPSRGPRHGLRVPWSGVSTGSRASGRLGSRRATADPAAGRARSSRWRSCGPWRPSSGCSTGRTFPTMSPPSRSPPSTGWTSFRPRCGSCLAVTGRGAALQRWLAPLCLAVATSGVVWNLVSPAGMEPAALAVYAGAVALAWVLAVRRPEPAILARLAPLGAVSFGIYAVGFPLQYATFKARWPSLGVGLVLCDPGRFSWSRWQSALAGCWNGSSSRRCGGFWTAAADGGRRRCDRCGSAAAAQDQLHAPCGINPLSF